MHFADLSPLTTRSPVLSTLLVTVLPLLFVYTLWIRIIYPRFYSPLARIPSAHPSAPFSSLWINYIRHQFRENQTLLEAHQRLGGIVRLGPNEVSINCVDNGLRTVYAGGYEKSEWYPNLFTNYNGVEIMFATVESGPHSARKRMMSNVYAKSHLQSSSTMSLVARKVIYERLLPLLQTKEQLGTTFNLRRVVECATMDFVTGYMLGYSNGSNFLQNPEEAAKWLTDYQSRKAYTFWPQEMPRLTRLLSRLGIQMSPKWVAAANHDLETWCLRHCDDAEDNLSQAEKAKRNEVESAGDHAEVYAQLRSQLQKEAQKPSAVPLSSAPHRLQIASEMLDHLSAGHETSGITLTFLFYELSRRPSLQRRLRAELQTVDPQITLSNSTSSPRVLPTAKTLDALPLLHATIMETLRRHPAIPGPQPRITPMPKRKEDNVIGPFTHIPAGVRISANAYCLHQNPQVFPDPNTWIPERWLDPFIHPALASDIAAHRPEGQEPRKSTGEEADVLKEMHRWFWAFGSGGRMCIGSNLAMLQMEMIVTSICSCFRIELVGLDDGKVPADTYTGAWGDGSTQRVAAEPLEVPVLGQQDAYTAQPLAERVNIRLLRWDASDSASDQSPNV